MEKFIETYEAIVPDTLELSDHAELALNGLAGTTDSEGEYLMWFRVGWNKKKPYLMHNGADVECSSKFLDDFQLMRVMTCSEKYLEYENGMNKTLLSFVSEDDGMYYAVYSPERPWYQNFYSKDMEGMKDDLLSIISTGIYMTTLVLRNDLQNGIFTDVLNKMAKGLMECAIDKGDYAYYPEDFKNYGKDRNPFTRKRGSDWVTDAEPYDEHAGPEGTVIAYFGNQIRGISMWAKRTGNKELLNFAGKLVKFIMRPDFWGNPSEPRLLCGKEHGFVDSHFHARSHGLRGMLEYGLAANDTEVCEFVRDSYNYMRNFGINKIGWIPTFPNLNPAVDKNRTMEGCFLGDALALMIKLSDSGIGDYWEDIDRMIRNTLVEAQFTDKERLEKVIANAESEDEGKTFYPNQITYENVVDRMIGTFASLIDVTGTKEELMQCCTGNAVRGLYYAWEAITRCVEDDATVNLFLNRAAPWLDISSYLPYEGKVVINNKKAKRISIRIPNWIKKGKLSCMVNNNSINKHFVAGYLVVDGLKPNDIIELKFDLVDETFKFTAHAKTDSETVYTIKMRANTVLDITPRDTSPLSYPFYLRDHLKGSKAPMKSIVRRVYPVIPEY